jgi:hypothetical protein
MDATAGPCVRVSTSEPGADGPASPPRPAPPSPPLSSPPLPPISPSPPPRRRRRINGMLQGGAQGTTTHRSIREARDLRRCQRTCNFSTFSTFFTASIAVSAASHCHHPIITGHRLPSSPSRHHHPVITVLSSPSRRHHHRPTCGADLLGVDPRTSTARRHLHPQAHRHRADLRTMSLAARAEDRPTRRTLKATWT